MNHSNSTVLILGDFNINLLAINDKPMIKDYFNNIIALGLIPYITLPTRVSDSSATLIDNIFCNSPDIRAGILLSDISDHYPYFCALNINCGNPEYKRKYIYCRKINNKTLQDLYQCLSDKKLLYDLQTDTEDPNENYKILEQHLVTAVNKCMPLKKIKYQKYKYKFKKTEWITAGLIRFIIPPYANKVKCAMLLVKTKEKG